jgi:hypothetical protein
MLWHLLGYGAPLHSVPLYNAFGRLHTFATNVPMYAVCLLAAYATLACAVLWQLRRIADATLRTAAAVEQLRDASKILESEEIEKVLRNVGVPCDVYIGNRALDVVVWSSDVTPHARSAVNTLRSQGLLPEGVHVPSAAASLAEVRLYMYLTRGWLLDILLMAPAIAVARRWHDDYDGARGVRRVLLTLAYNAVVVSPVVFADIHVLTPVFVLWATTAVLCPWRC